MMTVRTHVVPKKCYACDDTEVVGVAIRHEGTPPIGMDIKAGEPYPVAACARHAEKKARFVALCIYCSAPVGRNALYIDDIAEGDEYAHRLCHKEQCG